MTGWVIAMGLTVLLLGAMLAVGRLPRAAWEVTASALLLGLAGYAWQGHSALPGSPRQSARNTGAPFDEALAEKRRGLGERYGPAGQWLLLSDGLARQGNTADAANVLLSGLRTSPDDPNLWLGMGNALVAHTGGALSPGADFAFRRAIAIDPRAPAAPYFYGLALAQSGQLAQARKIWASLAARAPQDSQLRAELGRNIARIDAMQAAGSEQAR
ncbi:tetratricopeptide repeat protein [Sphingobium sp. AN558]|uniref:tetratricopeptide repeat protein n=1 Tax=Sphingobium sp. AN558 TaxID=3133442 RepID=UPI0030BCD429